MSAALPRSSPFRFVLRLCAAAALAGASRAATSDVEYLNLTLPHVGDHALHLLAPTMLEVRRINSKPPAPAPVDSWDFVDADYNFTPPPTSQFLVKVNGTPVSISAIGFKRRPFYAPNRHRDLRIENNLYLQLATPVASGQSVEVTNPGGQLWAPTELYTATADPSRYSPAIHVNQEGYVPSLPKKAMIGYYLGSLGELDVPLTSGFQLVNADTGAVAFNGALTLRPDVGYTYSPLPYQKVLEADFSAFTTPGNYTLVVPNLGASIPFRIDDGIAMSFLRTYALGIYHQRCGATNALPYTRFVHDACHLAPAEVPTSAAAFDFTWATIAGKNSDFANNPRHTAPQLKDAASQLYPFVNTSPRDVSGGHHDAGDYSKYTINSAALIHRLLFMVDTQPGAGALDNLGLPESGDGIGDLLQETKREADFLLKMQDADGGFYFLVYPKNREYEDNVLPDHGDPQVVWPKNTAATAAAVAALAQCASSPVLKQTWPAAATAYRQAALLGWQFLTQAIAQHGKDGAYQKLTFYGDIFMHDDELAWAACELFLLTGDASYQAKLLEWFPDPADPDTFRWGWVRLTEGWGNAIRSYAFAARSGRLPASVLNASYLAACETQILAAGDDALRWSNQNAYASSFPEEMKRFLSAGWYFSLDQASDMATAYLLDAKAAYVDALTGNMNYEGGCNPVNVTYLTGLGRKRQREIVHQFAQNDARALPPDGIPVGNIQAGFAFLTYYGSELGQLVFPSDGGTVAPYEFYDRWADSFNVTQEPITGNQARAIASLAVLATPTSAATQPWQAFAGASIVAPTGTVSLGTPTTLTLNAPGLNLTNASITWEARNQEPIFGNSYTIAPKNNGAQWAEAEIQWPDGRRVFATTTFAANSPVVNWVNGAIPAYGVPETMGGDTWTWVTSNPAPQFAPAAHQSALAPGIHLHAFRDTEAPLAVRTGDVLFAWVYLDPAHPPAEVMLTWSAGGEDRRAYWGANNIPWGTNNSPDQRYVGPLPPAGQWARLEVPASAVNLENSDLIDMAFVLYDGRATFDTAGVMAPTAPAIATHPASQSVIVGAAATLSVTASGVPAPTYQWRRNGTPISGATNSTYAISSAQSVNAGDYTVVVTNGSGSVMSNVATLAVLGNFASWQLEKFTASELADAAQSGPSAVFGLDGLPNLVKYALGLEPKQDAVAGLPVASVAGTDWTYTYTRPSDRTDLTYTVEVSTNLATWTTTGVAHTKLGTSGATETWQARYPLAPATNAFFRLAIASAAASTHTPPFGGLTISVPAGQTRSAAFPLVHASAGTGPVFNRIGAVGSNFLDVPAANWSAGAWSNAASPYYVRLRSGVWRGRTLMVTTAANTASRVFVNADGTNLTTAGLVTGANGDAFELVPADTLGSLFGSATLQGGTDVASADNVLVWSGASWLTFYFNTTNGRWQLDTDTAASPTRNTFVLRPDRGIMIARRAASALTFRVTGRVPEFAPIYWHQRPGVTFLSAGAPADLTLATLALQTRTTGWKPGSDPNTAASDADLIQVWSGASWLRFYFDSNNTRWQLEADSTQTNRGTFVIPAGRPIMIRRLTSSTDTLLSLPLPYTLAP